MTGAPPARGSSGSARSSTAPASTPSWRPRDESIAYLTGFRPLQLERLFAVVVRADGGAGVIVPKLDRARSPARRTSLERVSYDASSDGLPELAGLLGGAARVGVEEDHIVFARSSALAGRGLELVPVGRDR